MVRMLPREAELVSEWTGLPGDERFERSNGLDTALYKKDTYILTMNCERQKSPSMYSSRPHTFNTNSSLLAGNVPVVVALLDRACLIRSSG